MTQFITQFMALFSVIHPIDCRRSQPGIQSNHEDQWVLIFDDQNRLELVQI